MSISCLVCLDNFEPTAEVVSINRCGHVFHLNCLNEWRTRLVKMFKQNVGFLRRKITNHKIDHKTKIVFLNMLANRVYRTHVLCVESHTTKDPSQSSFLVSQSQRMTSKKTFKSWKKKKLAKKLRNKSTCKWL
jgi:hypothetical protein